MRFLATVVQNQSLALHAVAYEIKKPQKIDNNKLQEVKEKFQNWMLEAFPGIHFSCNKMSVTYIG